MKEKIFANIKRGMIVFLVISIIFNVLGIANCFSVEQIEPYKHAMILGNIMLYDLLFLLIVTKTTLSDDAKKK